MSMDRAESAECLLLAMVCISGGMGLVLIVYAMAVLVAQFLRRVFVQDLCNRGLTASQIQRLPIISSVAELSGNENSAQECCVCIQRFQGREDCIVLPGCRHVFHSQCVAEWLAIRAICPLCRATVSPSGQHQNSSTFLVSIAIKDSRTRTKVAASV